MFTSLSIVPTSEIRKVCGTVLQSSFFNIVIRPLHRCLDPSTLYDVSWMECCLCSQSWCMLVAIIIGQAPFPIIHQKPTMGMVMEHSIHLMMKYKAHILKWFFFSLALTWISKWQMTSLYQAHPKYRITSINPISSTSPNLTRRHVKPISSLVWALTYSKCQNGMVHKIVLFKILSLTGSDTASMPKWLIQLLACQKQDSCWFFFPKFRSTSNLSGDLKNVKFEWELHSI